MESKKAGKRTKAISKNKYYKSLILSFIDKQIKSNKSNNSGMRTSVTIDNRLTSVKTHE